MHCYPYPRPAVATDICLFSLHKGESVILLIQRGVEPYLGDWALPGGFLGETETLDQCAARELAEETGAHDAPLMPFGTFSDPARDPRGRTISVAYLALVPDGIHVIRSGSDASDTRWFLLSRLPHLAFDHAAIVTAARTALVDLLDRTPLALSLLPPKFTLTQLQKVHEAVAGRAIDKRNFRRSILARRWLVETGEMERGKFRPAMLYKASGG